MLLPFFTGRLNFPVFCFFLCDWTYILCEFQTMFYWSDCGWSEYLKITKQKKNNRCLLCCGWLILVGGGDKTVQFPLNCEYRTVVFISSPSSSEPGKSWREEIQFLRHFSFFFFDLTGLRLISLIANMWYYGAIMRGRKRSDWWHF